jgi:sulfatase maturation enzyme AslB (radical SAM superfamily)
MSNTPYCAWPWFHQKINANGRVQPCCAWDPAAEQHRHGYDHHTFFHSPYMDDLRERFSQGDIPASCGSCVYKETLHPDTDTWRKTGISTARILAADLRQPRLLSQEVDLSNICNLRCRSCGPKRSSKWIEDSNALEKNHDGLRRSNWTLSESQSQTIRHLAFLGGEPLLHQDMICVELAKVQARPAGLSDLYLKLCTNTTIAFSEQMIAYMIAAKKVHIDCSIDGVGIMNDYIRSDSNFAEIEQNLQHIKALVLAYPHIGYSGTYTYSIYNAHAFLEFADWWQQYSHHMSISLVREPKILDVINLPQHYKDQLIQLYTDELPRRSAFTAQLRTLLKHLHTEPNMTETDWRNKFLWYNGILDQRRYTALADVNPRLHTIISAMV